MTRHTQILIWKRRGKWSVKGGHCDQTFSGQFEAIKAGIEWANERGKNGKPAMVLCETGKRQFKKVWTYGVDDYPPTRSGLPEICTAAPVAMAE